MKRVGKWIVPLLAGLAPLIIFGSLQIESSTTDVAQWLPTDRTERQKYDEFLDLFGDDEFLAVSWQGCTPDDPRLEKFATEIRKRLSDDKSETIHRIVTTAEYIEQLTGPPAELSRSTALRRLQGVAVGPEECSVVLLRLSQPGTQQHARLIDLVLEVGEHIVGLNRDELRLSGSVYEAVTIDESSHRSLTQFVIPASLASFVVAWLCIGSLRLTVVALVIAGYCQIMSVAMVYYLGGKLNAVLIVLPTLIFMLTLSATVHMINYYRDVGGDPAGNSGDKAIRVGWMPCVLASVTTAIGLGSLLVSDLQPVRQFGLYSLVALLTSTIVLISSFSALISLHSRGEPYRKPHRDSLLTMWCKPVIRLILDHAGMISLVGIAILIGVGWGTTHLTSSVKLERMFPQQSEIVKNYHWFENNVGPLISVEVLVTFPASSKLNTLQRLALVSDVHAAAWKVPEVGGVVSPLTFLPPIPRGSSARNTIRRSLFRTQFESGKDLLQQEGVIAEHEGVEHWRVTAKVPAFHELDYGELTEKVRSSCAPIIEEASKKSDVSLTITGLSPVFHEAQQLLLRDLAKSFLLAFAIITPVMMVIMRSVFAGLLAMIPNLAPTALVFGVMGWWGIPLDIASILTASVALGIAVDDTLHFITWFSRNLARGLSTRVAVTHAYSKCAPAMIQTTLICCAAMLVFLPTDFLPTRKFAILMTFMLCGALIGDLVLLPAILSSPLGKVVFLRSFRSTSASTIQPDSTKPHTCGSADRSGEDSRS
jgi:predicted RND superfamily exporter protein